MNANWIIIVILLLMVIILVVFLIVRNQKDKQKLERYFNENECKQSEDQEEELNDVL